MNRDKKIVQFARATQHYFINRKLRFVLRGPNDETEGDATFLIASGAFARMIRLVVLPALVRTIRRESTVLARHHLISRMYCDARGLRVKNSLPGSVEISQQNFSHCFPIACFVRRNDRNNLFHQLSFEPFPRS